MNRSPLLRLWIAICIYVSLRFLVYDNVHYMIACFVTSFLVGIAIELLEARGNNEKK